MRNILLLLLVPAMVALVVLIALGTPGSSIAAAVVTMAGFVLAIFASRDSFQRQLQVLTRTTRGYLEGSPARFPEAEDTLDEVTKLARAIDTPHARLRVPHAQQRREA